MTSLNLNPPVPGSDAGNQFKRDEMTRELRKARNWILAVGIIQFVFAAIIVYAIYGRELPNEAKLMVMKYNAFILAFFVGMYALAFKKPVVACVLALVGFWGLHLYEASIDPSALYKGIILKVLFTVALINGIKSASNGEKLKKELEQVFG